MENNVFTILDTTLNNELIAEGLGPEKRTDFQGTAAEKTEEF